MDWEGSGSEQGWRKGPWTPEEDKLLSDYINLHGEGRWSSVSKYSGMFIFTLHEIYTVILLEE